MSKPQNDRQPSYGELPKLPGPFHTPEELKAWKAAVAEIPVRVIVPRLPEDARPEDWKRQAAFAIVETEQRIQAEAAALRTDPAQVAKRHALVSAQVRQLDAWIGDLQRRRDRLIEQRDFEQRMHS